MSVKALPVLLVALAILYYIGKEVIGAFRHLSDDELFDYWSGSLQSSDRKSYRRISEHLGSCEACRDRLDEVRKEGAGPGADSPMIERKY